MKQAFIHTIFAPELHAETRTGATARFMSNVAFGENGDCWLYTGAISTNGYGDVRYRSYRASSHRIAWELENGPIPEDVQVLHTCDVKRCCNTAHMYLGTRVNNAQDALTRGQLLTGERISWAKLTEQQVRDMRALEPGSYTKSHLAHKYGVSKHAIGLVFSGKNWKGA